MSRPYPLGYIHGPPNRVTYWRCHTCKDQGLMYGFYTYTDYVTCKYGCQDPQIELTSYTREHHELPEHSA